MLKVFFSLAIVAIALAACKENEQDGGRFKDIHTTLTEGLPDDTTSDYWRKNPDRACALWALQTISPGDGYSKKEVSEMYSLCNEKAERYFCMGAKDMIESHHQTSTLTCRAD
jgi:hypothetical protein